MVIERIQTDVLKLSEPSLTPTDAFRRRGIERTLSKMQQLPFLRDFVLSREHLAEFSAFCDPLVFEKGEDLLARGRSGEHMLFLLSGSAEVKVGPTRCVAIVAPDFCGESCMANPGRKRNATITATTRVECLKLSRRRLFLLYEYFAVDDECGAEAGASRVQAAMDKLVFKAGGPPSIQELQHACDAYSAAQEGRRRSRSSGVRTDVGEFLFTVTFYANHAHNLTRSP